MNKERFACDDFPALVIFPQRDEVTDRREKRRRKSKNDKQVAELAPDELFAEVVNISQGGALIEKVIRYKLYGSLPGRKGEQFGYVQIIIHRALLLIK